MKRILPMLVAATVLVACNDNTSTNNTTNSDSAQRSQPVQTAPADGTQNRTTDTASYERMPQKTTDSTHY